MLLDSLTSTMSTLARPSPAPAALVPLVAMAFQTAASTALPLLRSLEGTSGELTEAFYKFAAAVQQHAPEALAECALLASAVEQALVELGRAAQQVRASQAVVEALVLLTVGFEGEPGAKVRLLFHEYGREVVRMVVLSLAGTMPWHSFAPLADVLWNLIAEFRDDARGWLIEALSSREFDRRELTPEVKERLLNQLIKCKHHRSFRNLISDFAITCRG
jgi:hypothetical protein